jgi:hypothetical protein
MPRPACPRCGERDCSRKKREGLWQRFILPRFGWFPWRCSACQRVFLVRERGKSKRKKDEAGQFHTSHQPGQPLPSHDNGSHNQFDEE